MLPCRIWSFQHVYRLGLSYPLYHKLSFIKLLSRYQSCTEDSLLGMQSPFRNLGLNFSIHIIRALCRRNLDDLSLFFKVIYNGHACFDKGFEPFLDALGVIVCSARGLAPVDESLLHFIFWAVEEQGKSRRADRLFEFEGLVHFPREACVTLAL